MRGLKRHTLLCWLTMGILSLIPATSGAFPILLNQMNNARACGGAQLNGGCWYYGTGGQSCTTVCSTRGGTNDTLGVWAENSTNCRNAADAVSAAGSGHNGNWADGAYGCFLYTPSNQRFNSTGGYTAGGTSGIYGTSIRRICACQY